MRTYYRGPDAFVTAERFVWLMDTPKIVPVREMRAIQRIEHAARTRSTDALMVMAGGLATLAAAGWVTVGAVAGAALAALAVTAMLVAVCSRQSSGARSYRIVATVGGARTTIFESRDPRVFNQVTRALKRSLENDLRNYADYGLAAAS
jgi:hypothetical protein